MFESTRISRGFEVSESDLKLMICLVDYDAVYMSDVFLVNQGLRSLWIWYAYLDSEGKTMRKEEEGLS